MTLDLWPKNDKRVRGYFQKNWVGMCGTLPETLTLFQTKICDFPYHISDMFKNLIPYFRPDVLEPGAWPERVTSCYGTCTVVGVNIKREMVLSPNDEVVAILLNNISNLRPECTNHTLFQTKTALNDTLWRRTYPYSLYKGLPLGAKNALQIMSLAAYASETKKERTVHLKPENEMVNLPKHINAHKRLYTQTILSQNKIQ